VGYISKYFYYCFFCLVNPIVLLKKIIRSKPKNRAHPNEISSSRKKDIRARKKPRAQTIVKRIRWVLIKTLSFSIFSVRVRVVWRYKRSQAASVNVLFMSNKNWSTPSDAAKMVIKIINNNTLFFIHGLSRLNASIHIIPRGATSAARPGYGLRVNPITKENSAVLVIM
ncbi:MAG: hypothetical protein PVG32_14760, partial [Anaerolineales bacterium]